MQAYYHPIAHSKHRGTLTNTPEYREDAMDDIQTSQEDPYSSIYKTVSDHLQQAVDETRIWTAQELLLELEKVLDDMKNLVTAPSKSDASRQKIKSGG